MSDDDAHLEAHAIEIANGLQGVLIGHRSVICLMAIGKVLGAFDVASERPNMRELMRVVRRAAIAEAAAIRRDHASAPRH